MKKIESQPYKVETKHIPVNIDGDGTHKNDEATRIVVDPSVHMGGCDESEGRVRPYGLATDGVGDVEIKTMVTDSVIAERINAKLQKESDQEQEPVDIGEDDIDAWINSDFEE